MLPSGCPCLYEFAALAFREIHSDASRVGFDKQRLERAEDGSPLLPPLRALGGLATSEREVVLQPNAERGCKSADEPAGERERNSLPRAECLLRAGVVASPNVV